MGKREKVYLKDIELWGDIDHEGSAELFPETYAKLDSLTQFSNKKLSWKCSVGHVWQARTADRSSGNGCPFCSGRRASDSNRLSINRPELAREWDFDKNECTPSDVAVSSHKKAWWRCGENHSWQAEIKSRSQGSGCPFCSGWCVSDANRLSINKPELAREWGFDKNKYTPSDVAVSSNKKAWWVCAEGHSWQSTINNRSNGNGCPTCAKRFGNIENRFIEAFTDNTDFLLTVHGMRLNQLSYASGRSGVEVDIILYHNNHYLLIEYDGSYWHRDKAELDTEKSRLLLSLGDNILHVRIREDNLPELGLLHDRFSQFRHDYHKSEDDSIEATVKEIEKWFLEKIGA